MKPAFKIVIIDKDTSVLENLAIAFKEDNYEVRTASSGEQALLVSKSFVADLVLTEMILPDMDGIQLSNSIHTILPPNTPIVFLTDRYEEYSELAALKAGAADYIIKPVKLGVLKLRIQNALNKKAVTTTTNAAKTDSVVFKDLLIDKESYVVYKGEKKIQLPRKEFELLFYLGKNPNKTVPRKVLLNEIWSGENILSRTVDSHVRKLRKKIGEGYINTVIGIGYKLDY